MAPNGPHQHCVFLVSTTAHNLGDFRPFHAMRTNLENSNLEYFGNKASDLKMAITLVFLDLFKSFKRLK